MDGERTRFEIRAACRILYREGYGISAGNRILVRGILRIHVGAAIAKIPFKLLYGRYIGDRGVGIQGDGVSETYQAVVVKINRRFGGDAHVLLKGIRTSACIQGDKRNCVCAGLRVGVNGIGLGGGILDA